MLQDSPVPSRGLPPDRLRRFAAMLRELSGNRDVDETLQLMVDLAVELVGGVDVVDIMFVRSGEIIVPLSTDEAALTIDRLQQEAGEGPCLTALYEEEMVVSPDLEQEDRWPRFTPPALDLGVRSVAAYRLFREQDRDNRFGVMNMFGREPGLDEADVALAGVFAAHCSTVLTAVVDKEGLQSALRSRDIIGQAKGILMERHRLSPDDAYAMLRKASNDRNIAVRDLAQTVAETGALP